MTKKRAIVSYDKLSIEQKKKILIDFPDGYLSHMTTIKTPSGETLDALYWETDEIIYLVKMIKPQVKSKSVDDDEEDAEDDLPKFEDIKGEEEDIVDDEEEDDYDVADEEEDDSEE